MTATEILRNEHAVILEAVALLELHAGDVREGTSLDGDFARWIVQFIREFADGTHYAKEQGVLFGLLAVHGFSVDLEPLAGLLAEHAASRRLCDAMEAALGSRDAQAFALAALQFCGLLRRHIRTEEEVVFSAAERLLTPAEDTKAVQAFGRVVHEHDGVVIRQRHLAAIEHWRGVFEAALLAEA